MTKAKYIGLLSIVILVLSFSMRYEHEFRLESEFCESHFASMNDELLPVLQISHDFLLKIGNEEDYGAFKTFSHFELWRNGTRIFLDSSLNEYQFDNPLFPIVIQTGENSFELLFEMNDRPNKNYLKRLIIRNNNLIREDKLPTFEAKPSDINEDGILEYAGFWDYAQLTGEHDDLTCYNPILYYSIMPNGLQLDSLLTQKRNELIYGEFHGFSFNENINFHISVLDKFEHELKLIRGF